MLLQSLLSIMFFVVIKLDELITTPSFRQNWYHKESLRPAKKGGKNEWIRNQARCLYRPSLGLTRRYYGYVRTCTAQHARGAESTF